jgi:hypothetical protein
MDARISKQRGGIMRAGRLLAIAAAIVSAATCEKALAQGAYVDAPAPYGGSLYIYGADSFNDYVWVGENGDDVSLNIDYSVYSADNGEDAAPYITDIYIHLYEGSDYVDLTGLSENVYVSLTDIWIHTYDEQDGDTIVIPEWIFVAPPYVHIVN